MTIRDKLVSDAGEWHRWWSMRWIIATGFFAAVSAAYVTLPADWLPALPVWLKGALAVGTLLTAGAAGVTRVIKQAPKP